MTIRGSVRWLALLSGALAGIAQAQGNGGEPPPIPTESFQACSGAAEGTACQFTVYGRTLAGTCRTGPQGEAAACLPPHPGPPPEAFQACSGLSEGASCSVSFRGSPMAGTCRTGPQGGTLACAPSGPPPQR